MARPESNTVSYFPHKIGDGKKIFSIETKYGNDGYATWFKILEKLATTENHYLNLNDEVEVMYLSAKCKVSEELLFSIINDLTRLGCFDKTLWEKRYIWSQVFIDSIQDAYSRRNNKCITYDSLCIHLFGLCSTETKLPLENFDNNTQSKVKYSKVKNIDSDLVAPKVAKLSLEERKKAFRETLVPFVKTDKNPLGKFDKDMVKDFFEKWTEPTTKVKNKMRFELEKSWDAGLRLSTWKRNDFGNKNKFIEKQTLQTVYTEPKKPIDHANR